MRVKRNALHPLPSLARGRGTARGVSGGGGALLVAVLLVLSFAVAACDKRAPPAPPRVVSPRVSTDSARIALFNRGAGLLGTFEFEQAEKVFTELAAKYPDDREAKLALAISILNQSSDGAQERARTLLEPLIASKPDDVRAQYAAGIVELFLGNPEQALPHFKFVAGSDPTDPYAAYYVAQCLEYAGRFDDALPAYRRAAEIDSYLRSPHLGAQRVLARLGREAEAADALKSYLALDGNPRGRLAEFKYTRMGKKAEVRLASSSPSAPAATPNPPFFEAEAVIIEGDVRWRADGAPPNMTVADIDGDGELDLFITKALADGSNAVLLAVPQQLNHFRLDAQHPLALVKNVHCALWGDVDNDGRTDCYLCRAGPNQLWRNEKSGWSDITSSSKTGGGDTDTVDGAIVDLDHDGDLDLFLVNANGPCELLSNNLDGTFRAIGKESGAIGDGRPARRVVIADFDRDRDADIFLVRDAPPHEMLLNDRLWRYRAEKPSALSAASIDAAVATDADADGAVDVVTVAEDGQAYRWHRSKGDSDWTADAPIATGIMLSAAGGGLAVLDVDGSGEPRMVARNAKSFVARSLRRDLVDETPNPPVGTSMRAWTPIVRGVRGPALVVLSDEGLAILGPTATRGQFLTLSLSGLTDPSQAMRSNASGIGAMLEVRRGETWSFIDTFRATSGPGQSLQPIAIGLGDSKSADFVSIEWSDGVLQTELAVAGDRVQAIVETQRQISSCPVIFVWDGAEFRFVTDCLGVGGLGYLVGVKQGTDGRLAPEYAPPRPWERVLLPASITPAPRDGAIELRLTEPMEEALYLDAARLVAYDVPPGWSLTIDERMGLADPQPTGEVRAFRRSIAPARATDVSGANVLPAIASVDGVAADVGEVDPRFVGLLRLPQSVTLEFDAALDELAGAPVLIAHGWIEYPYCQTNFAAWQAGVTFDAPDLWARGTDGVWVKVLASWGYPAGMPREMSLPLDRLPPGTTALRLSTNQEVYWDAFEVAWTEPCHELVRHALPLLMASAEASGFQQRVPQPQKRPLYDYATRLPFWATRHQPGFYTAFGPCEELVGAVDDAVAVIGPGEEVRLRFAAPASQPPKGWSRRYVLELDGWCKDMDLFTGAGETLGPLPRRGESANPQREELHRRFQTRWRDGY